jgi:hypothetical protein
MTAKPAADGGATMKLEVIQAKLRQIYVLGLKHRRTLRNVTR